MPPPTNFARFVAPPLTICIQRHGRNTRPGHYLLTCLVQSEEPARFFPDLDGLHYADAVIDDFGNLVPVPGEQIWVLS
jgi:hypothetical protein